MKVRLARMAKYEDDLNGTRKIIQKVIDWHTVSRQLEREEGH